MNTDYNSTSSVDLTAVRTLQSGNGLKFIVISEQVLRLFLKTFNELNIIMYMNCIMRKPTMWFPNRSDKSSYTSIEDD